MVFCLQWKYGQWAYSSGWYGGGGGAAFNFTRTTEPNWAFRTQTQTSGNIGIQFRISGHPWEGGGAAFNLREQWRQTGARRDEGGIIAPNTLYPQGSFCPTKNVIKLLLFVKLDIFAPSPCENQLFPIKKVSPSNMKIGSVQIEIS